MVLTHFFRLWGCTFRMVGVLQTCGGDDDQLPHTLCTYRNCCMMLSWSSCHLPPRLCAGETLPSRCLGEGSGPVVHTHCCCFPFALTLFPVMSSLSPVMSSLFPPPFSAPHPGPRNVHHLAHHGAGDCVACLPSCQHCAAHQQHAGVSTCPCGGPLSDFILVTTPRCAKHHARRLEGAAVSHGTCGESCGCMG